MGVEGARECIVEYIDNGFLFNSDVHLNTEKVYYIFENLTNHDLNPVRLEN